MDSDGDRWPCDGPDAHRNCGVAIRRAPVAKTYTHTTSGLGATTLLCNDKRILRPSLDFCSTSRNNYALVTAGGEHSTLENLRVSDKIAPHRSCPREFDVNPVAWRAAPQRVAIYGRRNVISHAGRLVMKRIFLVILVVAAFLVAGAIAQTADAPGTPHARKKRIAIFDFGYATVQSASAAVFGTNVDVGKGIADLLVRNLVKDGT